MSQAFGNPKPAETVADLIPKFQGDATFKFKLTDGTSGSYRTSTHSIEEARAELINKYGARLESVAR